MGDGGAKLTEPAGIVRILSIVCVFVALCCWFLPNGAPWNDEGGAYSVGLIICFIFSVVLLLLGLFGGDNDAMGMVDKIFHICAAIHMIIVTIILLAHSRACVLNICFGASDQALAAESLGLIYGVLCAVLAFLLFKG